MNTALAKRVEAGCLDERHPGIDALERSAVEQIGHADGVPGGPGVISEYANAGRETLGVVEQQDLGHGTPPVGTDTSPSQRLARLAPNRRGESGEI